MSTRKETIKVRAELNDIEIIRTIQSINKFRSWFFEKINKIDKPLTIVSKKKKRGPKINNIKNKRGEVTFDTREIQRIVKITLNN